LNGLFAGHYTDLSSQVAALLTPFYDHPCGGVRLYEADALELLRMMRDESVDMIFADPPYFLSNGGITCIGGRMARVDKGRWDKSKGFVNDHNFNLLWLEQCQRILKPNGTIWVTGTSHNIYSVGYALQMLGYKLLNDIAWYKVNPPPNLSCRYFTHATETILWAAKSVQSKHTFQYALMKEQNGGKQMQSLWQIMPPGKAEKRYGKHPAQKPLALLNRIITASSLPGQIILDPFCGSATTGIACAKLSRLFVGIDKEKEYLELAINRLEEEISSAVPRFIFPAALIQSCEKTRQEPVSSEPVTWSKIVFHALLSLGGEGDLKDINRIVGENPRTQFNRTWPSTVRRVLRQSPEIAPLGRGRYKMQVQIS
jgi:site-specific DNA-methyltransferase (adenine-specific)